MSPADKQLTEQMPIPRLPPRPRAAWPALTLALIVAVAAVAVALVFVSSDDQGVRSTALKAPVTTVTTVAAAPTTPTTAATSATTTAPAPTTPTTVATQPERLSSSTRLSLDGLGPIDIGMTLAQASAAAGTPITYGDEYAPDNSCRYARAANGPDGLGFMVIDGRIARIDVGTTLPSMRPSPVRTVSGIGLGATENEVKSTYPGRIRVEPAKYDPNGHDLVYEPADPALRHLSMIFVTDGQRVTSFRAGLAGPVGYVEGCS